MSGTTPAGPAGSRSANAEKHERTDPVSRWHLRAFKDAIYCLVQRTGARSVLDAGCGEGYVTHYLAGKDPGLRLTGVDVREEAIAYARSRFPDAARFQRGSLYKLPFSDNSFDAVLCSEVLEHVKDVDRALQELKRVSRRYVIITVPREPFFKWFTGVARAVRFCSDPGHIHFWSHSAFRALIRRHFRILAMERKHVMYQLALAELREEL